jgi:fatty acid/phospholipid biosynthesis enzyme
MVRSAVPPRIFDEPQDSLETMIDDYIAQIVLAEETDSVPAIDGDTGNAVLKAAENCAATVLCSVLRMPCEIRILVLVVSNRFRDCVQLYDAPHCPGPVK